MQKLLNEVEYFNENDLQNVHQRTKNEAVENVRNKTYHEVRYFFNAKYCFKIVQKTTKTWR